MITKTLNLTSIELNKVASYTNKNLVIEFFRRIASDNYFDDCLFDIIDEPRHNFVSIAAKNLEELIDKLKEIDKKHIYLPKENLGLFVRCISSEEEIIKFVFYHRLE